jgi:hypothetical protein
MPIRCWLNQHRISLGLDSRSRWPRAVARHLAGCPECRDFAETQRALVRQLVRSAPALEPSSGPWRPSRIMAAVEAEMVTPAPKAHGINPGWAIALLSILVVLATWYRSSSPAPRDVASPLAGPASVLSGAFGTNFSLVSPQRLLELSGKADEPLEQELRHMVADATAAAQSLAREFLPDRP